MRHLNPYRFYELAAKLHDLFNNTTQNRVADMFAPLTETQAILDAFIKGDPFPLETSKADASKLLGKISSLFNRYYIDHSTKQLKTPSGEDRIDSHEMALVRALLEKFEHALAAELNHALAYTVERRGIYSIYDLIENAAQTFPADVAKYVPAQAINEFNAAGKALALEMATAAAMHLLRSVEITLKQYYELFSGTTVSKTERSYGIYLKKLANLSEDESVDFRPDKRLLQMLALIKEHYRNPLISPDYTVTLAQATSLFGLAGATIPLMAEQIKTQHSAEDIESEAEEDVEESYSLRETG